jgi:hypothetical protein
VIIRSLSSVTKTFRFLMTEWFWSGTSVWLTFTLKNVHVGLIIFTIFSLRFCHMDACQQILKARSQYPCFWCQAFPKIQELCSVAPYCSKYLKDFSALPAPFKQQILLIYRILNFNSSSYEEFYLWDIMPCSPIKSSDILEEHVASIFRVKE